MDYILGGDARGGRSTGVLRKKAANEATRHRGSTTERGRARDGEREWGEEDMVRVIQRVRQSHECV